jgi:hypothetical protein
MPQYYVNKNTHEVHKAGCRHSPRAKNRVSLGNHSSCGPAKRAAQAIYSDADGCGFCCPKCSKR